MTLISKPPTEPRSEIAFGASVPGPAHSAAGLPNQDAWACIHWFDHNRQRVNCAVVCDGLGSRPHAREGALAAVRAAKQAARQWARAPGAPVSLLVRLVEVLWRLEVAPLPAGDCASTCLIILTLPESESERLVLLILGDGLVAVESADGLRTWGGRADDQFSNMTLGLGTPHQMDDWQVQDLKISGQFRVLLLSDGIADDVPVENVAEFLAWVAGFEVRPVRARGAALRRSLRHWPVPGHTDDKTLVYLRMGAR